MPTILQIANADRSLSTLIRSIRAAGLEEALNEKGPFTLLAPVNLAFERLKGMDELLQPANRQQLIDLLSMHILVDKRLHRDFSNGQLLTTIHGHQVPVIVKDDEVHVNGAKILSRNKQGSNGVIHSVDTIHAVS